MLYPATGSEELLGAFQLTNTVYEDATPVPLRLTVADGLLDELLLMVSVPVAAPAVVGSNSTVMVADWFGFSVTEEPPPVIVKPVPLIDGELTATGEPPVEVSVTDCVVGVFRLTSPKEMLVVLMVSVGVDALNCSVKFSETLPARAVNVTVAALENAETVAEKLAVVAPAATVTEVGTETELLLLARPTVNPPLGAAALTVTVQLSVPAPVIEALVQESPVSTGTPVPLKAIVVEVPAEELLDKVN
jgi:hypothetical protein